MNDDPDTIARDAVSLLGETPGDDPVEQLLRIARQADGDLTDARDHTVTTGRPHDAHGRLLDRARIARIATVRVHTAQEIQSLKAMHAARSEVMELTESDGGHEGARLRQSDGNRAAPADAADRVAAAVHAGLLAAGVQDGSPEQHRALNAVQHALRGVNVTVIPGELVEEAHPE